MSVFGFFGGRRSAKPAVSVRTPSLEAPAEDMNAARMPVPGSDAVLARVQALRHRLHAHLMDTSKDYTVLATLRTSRVVSCDDVTREVIKRLAHNPFFEVLQQLDDAQLELQRGIAGAKK